MAISKNRLEELIKQGATIYTITSKRTGGDVMELHLKNISDDFWYFLLGITEELFEDKAEVEEKAKKIKWALKYHATRTEELNLPTWEEFDKNNKTICFTAKDWQCYELGFAFGDTETICLDKIVLGVNINQKNWKATEENYIKACDLCLKLFKGN